MSAPPAVAARAMRLSVVDGVFYALMVGCGESYFLADGVRLGGTSLELGLIVTLPLFTGAAGSAIALRLLRGLSRRKGLVVATALGQSLLLGALALAAAPGAMSPPLLIAAACLYHACGQAAGTAWSSWYGDLVPKEIRGRYFARRNRFVHLAACFGLVGAGLLLQAREPGAAGEVVAGTGGAGYRLVFGCAAVFRLVSVVTLALSPELPFRGLSSSRQLFRFLATGRGRRAWRLLATGAALQLTVYFASPYFAPFMLEQLRFTYIQYMAASLTVVTCKVALLPAWGRVVDRYGARQVYALAAVLIAIVPLPWLWSRSLLWVILAQALSGASWAGYEVSFFSTLLDASTKRTRPLLFGAQSLLNGTAQLLGGLAGAAVLTLTARNFVVVFGASLLARVLVALRVPRLVPPARGPQPIGRRALMLRVIGLRAHGGLVHRPIGGAGEDEVG